MKSARRQCTEIKRVVSAHVEAILGAEANE